MPAAHDESLLLAILGPFLKGRFLCTCSSHSHECVHAHTLFVLGLVFSRAALKVPTSAPRFLSVADLGP